MSMFNNYPQPDNYIPNNRPVPFKIKKYLIMAGETSVHSFIIPFNVEKVDFKVIYKLGLDVIIEKDKNSCSYSEDEIICSLSKDETLLFTNTLLSASVQIKFTMPDLSILYSPIYSISLMSALDSESEQPPVPQVIVGIGYTED